MHFQAQPDPQAQAHIEALKEQQLAAERAVQHAAAVVAAAAQQAAQLESERAAAQVAIAEAEQQRRHAEDQLAAQQAHLAQLQATQHPLPGGSAPAQLGMPPNTSGPLPAFNGASSMQGFQDGMLNGGGPAASAPAHQLSASPPPSAQDYYQNAMNAAAGGPQSAPYHQHAPPPYQAQGFPGSNFQSQSGAGGPPLPPQQQMSQPQPLGCEFCGRWLSEMALDQGNHMCDEFWQYSAEFQAVGAKSALLIGGVQHLKQEHLQSLAARFPNLRKVKHGPGFSEFNGLFTLSDEQGQLQALRLLLACGVRTIPLGHAASWRCLHVQLAPGNSPQRVGQAEQALQNQLHRLLHPDTAPKEQFPSAGRGRGQGDAWAQRANDAQRRLDPHQQHQSQYYVNPPMPPGGSSPGATPGDWKCPNCANINFAFREKCNRCNTPRPGAKLFGPMQQTERRICPFTVMLMRVPPQATEAQVAEALLQFGEIAAGGIKFHRQGAKFKQRRGRLPPDGLALHAFCRFIRPASASAALQRGEFTVFGQPVQINPAFMRGAMPSDALAAGMGSEMPPLPQGMPPNAGGQVPSDWGQSAQQWQGNSNDGVEPGIYGQLASLSVNDGASNSKHEHLSHFLHVAMQVLWQFKDFRKHIMALPPSSDPLVSGVQTIMVSLSEQRNSSLSSALLHTALHGVYAEQGKFDQVNDACEALEVVVGKFCASPDRRFAGCVEHLLGINIMEMCECSCGEMLEPMTYKQSACFVSVPALLGAQPGQPGSLLHQLSTAIGPSCPLPNCAKQMSIQRYLMQPTPQVLAVSFTYDSMGGAAYEPNVLSAVFARVETQFDLQQTYKGVAQPMMVQLVGMLCCAQGVPTPRYSAFFFDATARQWCSLDDSTYSPIGPHWSAVAAHCPPSQIQPAVLFYQVQPSSSGIDSGLGTTGEN